MHRAFAEVYDNDQLGDSVAITTGDQLIAMTSKIVGALPFPEMQAKEARRLFSGMFAEVCLGQQLDLLGNIKEEVDEAWVMKVMEFKTARYTVEKPLLIGAALGGASEEQSRALSSYAIKLGIAFQVQDDILGMYGDEQKVGKDVDSDLKEGKKTLLVIKAIEGLREVEASKELDRFFAVLGNPGLTRDDYFWTQRVMRETVALDYSRQIAQQLIGQSKQALLTVKMEEKPVQYLLGIADYMLSRKY